ncbi:IclR family transcriptional regulator [Oricola sp.]|uniref:IclR family transcriptional regulator n=1 Tax=Oricola sp. TaxID=1979950 RepID=UPI0025E12858|nr:IclR family transcriptional regulator [Oricola sp.]MCI5074795.1 IclR family transcriptional regulator [Oricola sp.]
MGTVSKALSLLTNFNQSRTEIGLSEIARLAGINKATAYRLLTELQDGGFVEQAGPEKSYRLGPEVLRLARLREAAVPLTTAARPILDRLADITHETAHVSAVRGMTLHALAHAYSPRHATRVMMEDAEILSFHGTGSGLAVLAFSPKAFVDAVLAQPLTRHTPETVTDPDALNAMFAPIRETGVAVSIGGFEADVHSHATPVFNAEGRPIGALAVAAPVARVTADRIPLIVRAVLDGAAELTRAIGGFAPDGFPETAI